MTSIILPVKPFDEGKSRLRGVLLAEEVEQFNKKQFEWTLSCAEKVVEKPNIFVISHSHEVLQLSANLGFVAEEEIGNTLNDAVMQGMHAVDDAGGGPVLILPTDLPLLSENDIRALLDCTLEDPEILIVPDRTYSGTNALLLSKPHLIQPEYGSHSFLKHCNQAADRHLNLTIYHNKNIQMDIDTPEDLFALRQLTNISLTP